MGSFLASEWPGTLHTKFCLFACVSSIGFSEGALARLMSNDFIYPFHAIPRDGGKAWHCCYLVFVISTLGSCS